MIRKSLQVMLVDTQADLPVTADPGQIAYVTGLKLPFTFDGTNWSPSSRTVVKKSTVAVLGKTVGTTKIYTLEPSTLNFYPLMVVFRAVSVSGVTIRPTISVGTNATAYDNIVAAGLVSTLLSTLSAGSGAPQSASTSPALAGGTDIFANVSVAATATNYTVNVEVVGFYDA